MCLPKWIVILTTYWILKSLVTNIVKCKYFSHFHRPISTQTQLNFNPILPIFYILSYILGKLVNTAAADSLAPCITTRASPGHQLSSNGSCIDYASKTSPVFHEKKIKLPTPSLQNYRKCENIFKVSQNNSTQKNSTLVMLQLIWGT